MKKPALVISCEHAVDTVPKEYSSLFAPFKTLLASHRGIDFGSLTIAQQLNKKLSCDFVQATTTRLLVDCNRSINHPACFSEVTKNLAPELKQQIINQYYLPFREPVIALIKKHLAQGSQVVHLSIHSFTPVMNDIKRTTDIGLLYDPRRSSEKHLARQWKYEIQRLSPEFKVRMNYPYVGTSDGFTSAMRKQFTNDEYMGIEVESNQALTNNEQSLNTLKNILSDSLLKILY